MLLLQPGKIYAAFDPPPIPTLPSPIWPQNPEHILPLSRPLGSSISSVLSPSSPRKVPLLRAAAGLCLLQSQLYLVSLIMKNRTVRG